MLNFNPKKTHRHPGSYPLSTEKNMGIQIIHFLVGFSILTHPFGGTHMTMETHWIGTPMTMETPICYLLLYDTMFQKKALKNLKMDDT